MKKILPISLLTLCFAATSYDQASAWINSRFGVGFNWSWQSGGNNLLWGLFRDGQPPAPCPMPGCAPMMPGPIMGGPMGGCPQGYPFPGPHQSYGPNEFPFFGRNNSPAAPGANLPQTAQNGYNGVQHPVGYSPAAQHGYNYPQYPAGYGYNPYYRR